MNKAFSFIKNGAWPVTVAVVVGVFAVVLTVQGATIISTDINTAGFLSASSTLTASSTLYATGPLFNFAATTLGDEVGDTILFNGLATASSSLRASSTLMTTGASVFHGAMVLGDETGDTITINGNIGGTTTINFTGTTPSAVQIAGTASTSKLQIGGDNVPVISASGGTFGTTTLSGLVMGYCNIATITIVATSSDYAICSSATGVRAGDRVFIQATSSLPEGMMVEAASTTAAATIGIRIFNAGLTGGANLATGAISFNFWAWR